MKRQPHPTQEQLREAFHYSPETGWFWRTAKYVSTHRLAVRRARPRSVIAGCVNRKGSGYVLINFGRRLYAAHRLAWIYVHGSLEGDLDHINGVRTDNRIANLRLATTAENNRNTKLRKDNTSGVKGVSFHKLSGLWHAYVTLKGVSTRKYFKTKDEAAEFVTELRKIKHGEFANHG